MLRILLLIAIILAATGSARALPPGVSLIQVAPGCEDFAFDAAPSGDRLILSCDDRRHPHSQGALWAMDLKSHKVQRLEIRGYARHSFHPHGLSLIRRAGRTLLYVINHQHKSQSLQRRNFTEVLIFEVEQDRLTYVNEIGSSGAKHFAAPNDLVALPSGEVFMSNPMSTSRSLLYYSPHTLRWTTAARGFLYPNGVHHLDGQIFLNSSVSGKQFAWKHLGEGRLAARSVVARGLGALDNITENDDGWRLSSGANSFVEFLRYFLKPGHWPSSGVWRSRGTVTERLASPDLSTVIKAPSVAYEYRDRLYLGQVFESFVSVIEAPRWERISHHSGIK